MKTNEELLNEIKECAEAIVRNMREDIAPELREDIWVSTAACHAVVILQDLQCLTQAQEGREGVPLQLPDDPAIQGTGEYDQGLMCGVEDRGFQRDGYSAMRYGYDRALERVNEWLAARPIPSPGAEATIEDAARFLEKKSRDHWSEHGSHEPDTGAPGPEAVVEYCDLLDELAAEIRALKPRTPEVRS
jgi:hypothetical protein